MIQQQAIQLNYHRRIEEEEGRQFQMEGQLNQYRFHRPTRKTNDC